MSDGRFEGRGFVVTGGTRGVGRAIVLGAAAEGATVVFCGRPGSERVAEEVVAAAGEAAPRVSFVAADVSREADVDRLFDEAVGRLPQVDVLVNNAGIARDRLLIETSLDEWNEVLAVNLRGPFLCARRAIDEFLGSGGGRIVNVSSIIANGSVGQAAYAASKAALISLTRSIAKEYGRRGIACNAVVPGFLETDMVASMTGDARRARERLSPERRFGRPEEAAEAVLFLASSDASFVNGDALYVAGAVRDVPELR